MLLKSTEISRTSFYPKNARTQPYKSLKNPKISVLNPPPPLQIQRSLLQFSAQFLVSSRQEDGGGRGYAVQKKITMRTWRTPGRYTTSQTLYFSKDNKEVGFLEISNLPSSIWQKVLFEYHKDKKDDAIAKYKMLINVVRPNICRIVAFDSKNTDRVIGYERTDFTLEKVILNKELFWKFDQGKLICMTEEYQKFITGIWKGLLYLHKEKISVKFEEDFEKIFLVDGKLSQPKFCIMNKVGVTTGSDNDLKLSASILKLIILGIHKRQGLQTSHRGLENLVKMLDVIHYCQNPLQAVKEHPEISGTRGKVRIVKTVYDRLLSGRLADIEEWFRVTRSVKLSYLPWHESLGDSPVKSVFLKKRERYVTQGVSAKVQDICGLVKLLRDSMHHVNDHVDEDAAEFMKDEDIVGFFDSRFPDFFVELHHYIHKLNPARHLMIVGSIRWYVPV